jgi:hypothetical protein
MLRFFRQLRQRLLSDNKFSKYLLYAIGEILLVVIGILIALQIDNWNEDRIKRNAEHELLLNLKEELVTNRALLIEAISYTSKSMSGARQVVEIYQDGYKGYQPSELDSLLGICQWAWTYDPVMGVPISIRTSGQINTIRNDELRLFVASFEEMVRDVQEEGNLLREMIVGQFMPMVGKYVSSNNRSHFIGEGYAIVETSVFESDYEGLFADRELENLITYIHVWRNDQLSEENAFLKRLDHTLKVLNEELNRWE